jgi:hypothetical protein
MIEKEGKFPCNARVDVDYSKGKPKVKFSYLTKKPKKEAINQNFYSIQFVLLFMIIMYGLIIFFSMYTWEVDYPKECNGYFYGNESLNRIEGFNITCDTGTYNYSYSNKQGFYGNTQVGFKHINNASTLKSLAILGYLILSGVIAFLVCYILIRIFIRFKWYQRWNPKFQSKLGKKKYYKFKKEDVDNNMVEIPYFGNVMLDYKTKGDFNKYLLRIKIREHKYSNFVKDKKNKGKYKIGKLKKQEYKWYARFFFKEKPKKGYLEVIYQ